MFKMIKYIFSVKKGIEQPEELVQDVSSSLFEGFFASILASLGVAISLFAFVGFYFDFGFFRFLAYLSAFIFLVVFILFRVVKKMTGELINSTSSKVRSQIQSEHRIVDIEIDE